MGEPVYSWMSCRTSRCVGVIEGSPEPIKALGLLRGGSTGIGGFARVTALDSHFPQPHGSGRGQILQHGRSLPCRALLHLQPSPARSAGTWPWAVLGCGLSVPVLGAVFLVPCGSPDSGGATGNSTKLASPPQISRVNGCSPPRNAFQIVSWTVFLTLSLAIFGIFIPFLCHVWKYIAYVVAGGVFFFHLIFHLIACCIDPADPNVRLKKDYSQPMPIFDRSKHAHVIQNHYCHLCKVTVTKKAKHCIACNKCVSGFDHHCKLLNNCVGSRNYWFFFSTVASAVAGLLCVIAILLYVLIQYILNPWVLRTDPKYADVRSANTWLLFLPLFPVKVTTQMVVVIGAAVFLLDLLGLLLLGQLLLFHIYLKVKKMTTLDYLSQTREEEERSKCQAERKGPSVQMGEGFLQVPPVPAPFVKAWDNVHVALWLGALSHTPVLQCWCGPWTLL
ncbi:probable palmitoyltransferase ZDHHC11B [Sapajus apella]|uniref:Palmitoyltransferase n=1 Tax=Sapajus apella TaxID=9515 RepID=A0A6J3HXF2_SAPAP|nr:probable palmitoyltransferase ZDHHC11B [Sapajus apella]